MKIEVSNERDRDLYDSLVSGIREYNNEKLGEEETLPLSVVVHDESGVLIGGLYGGTAFKHFFINVVWVDKKARKNGLGRKIMELAEVEAKKRGCIAAQVDTLSIQAPVFYEKLGFETVGKAPGITEDLDRYFLLKKYL